MKVFSSKIILSATTATGIYSSYVLTNNINKNTWKQIDRLNVDNQLNELYPYIKRKDIEETIKNIINDDGNYNVIYGCYKQGKSTTIKHVLKSSEDSKVICINFDRPMNSKYDLCYAIQNNILNDPKLYFYSQKYWFKWIKMFHLDNLDYFKYYRSIATYNDLVIDRFKNSIESLSKNYEDKKMIILFDGIDANQKMSIELLKLTKQFSNQFNDGKIKLIPVISCQSPLSLKNQLDSNEFEYDTDMLTYFCDFDFENISNIKDYLKQYLIYYKKETDTDITIDNLTLYEDEIFQVIQFCGNNLQEINIFLSQFNDSNDINLTNFKEKFPEFFESFKQNRINHYIETDPWYSPEFWINIYNNDIKNATQLSFNDTETNIPLTSNTDISRYILFDTFSIITNKKTYKDIQDVFSSNPSMIKYFYETGLIKKDPNHNKDLFHLYETDIISFGNNIQLNAFKNVFQTINHPSYNSNLVSMSKIIMDHYFYLDQISRALNDKQKILNDISIFNDAKSKVFNNESLINDMDIEKRAHLQIKIENINRISNTKLMEVDRRLFSFKSQFNENLLKARKVFS